MEEKKEKFEHGNREIFWFDKIPPSAFYKRTMHLPAILSRSLFALCALGSLASVQAGGFGGPAPFQNGSPLLSGTDGVYQAVASAKNVTGLIGFSILNGYQTSTSAQNTWIMFVDGQVLSGQTSANISGGKVTGVLDTNVSGSFPTNDDGTVDLPIAFVVPGNAGAGEFRANIDLQDPVAAFNGTGTLSGTPSRTDQIVLVSDEPNPITGTWVEIVPIVIPASDLGSIDFKVRGSRLSTP